MSSPDALMWYIMDMKTLKIGINGFGRIGRNAARIILSKEGMTLAAINSLSDASSHAYLLKHDSSQGEFEKDVTWKDEAIEVGGTSISVFQSKEVAEIPWEKANVDVVLECTGRAKTKEDAASHVRGGVKHVVISAPVSDDIPTYIMGVNHALYTGESIVSNSSCTTNCVTTVLQVLDTGVG